jgi:acetyl esterase/lipase
LQIDKPGKNIANIAIAGALVITAASAALRVAAAGVLDQEPKVAAGPVLEDRYPAQKTEFPEGVTGFADVTYSRLDGFRPLTLDVYVPAGDRASQRNPLIIYVHGGGWSSGHTRHSGAFENWPKVLASLAARGYVVSSLNYRLSREAPFPAAIHDVKAAIRWLRSHAQDYGIDKNRVVLWGGSAGGQLVSLAAMSCGSAELEPPASSTESDCVQGAVAWYGVFNFATVAAPDADANGSPVARYLGCPFPKCPADTVRRASPIRYADASDPPMLLIHGVNDRVVPVAQSKEFHDALKKAGVPVEMLLIPDVDHSFIGGAPEITKRASLTALEKTLSYIDALFKPQRE